MKLFGGRRSVLRDSSEKINNRRKPKPAIIAAAAAAALIAVIVFVIISTVKPPTPPSIKVDDPKITPDTRPAFYPPEFHPEDENVGGGEMAPVGITDDHRKPGFFTFLIFGLDDGINTDTIMAASYDSVGKTANLINFPRDCLVNVKRRTKKINAAYPAGTLNGGGFEGGVEQLKREVKTIIGFVPDFYIVVDMEGFVKIVDLVGGVEVDVPFDLKYNDPDQDLKIDIKAGENKLLNGEDALKFARYRNGEKKGTTISDYDRINNQHAVITSLMERTLRIENITKIRQFTQIVSESVKTDLGLGELTWLGLELEKVRGTESLHTYTMPTKGTSGSPSWYEYLDKEAVIELVNKTINPYTVDITADDVDIIDKLP
jgi:LCP family protein required for cell wall assembly